MLYTIPLYIHQNFDYQNLVTLKEEEEKEKIWLSYWSFQHLAEILYILTNKTWGKYGKMNGFIFIMVKILIFYIIFVVFLDVLNVLLFAVISLEYTYQLSFTGKWISKGNYFFIH